MVFPIGDDNDGRATTPVVKYPLIAADVLVFAFPQGTGSGRNPFTYALLNAPAYVALGPWFLFRPVSGHGPLGGGAIENTGRTFRWQVTTRSSRP